MSEDIYSYLKDNFNIKVTDYNFKRDYIKNPLKLCHKKVGSGTISESPNKEDLEYLIIKLNLKKELLSKLFNKSRNTITKWIKLLNISIPKENILEKRKQTNLEKYGVENIMFLDSTKNKIQQTCIERYGYKNPFQNNTIKDKIKQTNLEKYGKKSFTQTNDYIEKTKQTNLEKYGVEWQLQSNTVKDKIKQTNLEKYGVENYTQSNEYIEKTKQTNLEKYNREWSNQRHISLDNIDIMKDKDKLTNFITENDIINSEELSRNLGIGEPAAAKYVRKYNLKHLMDYSKSVAEKEIREYVNQYFETSNNDREIIKPYELDIYIPSLNKAIEYNGDYWHNYNDHIKNKDLIKQIICKQRKIDLLVIWEHDYINNKDEVYKKINDFLNITC